MQHYVIGTAGHVDHGKSALVQALTGIDPDRLPEEKARGITIDLGFAHLTIPASDRHPELHVGIVDVPGHEDFVKNMVAGVGSIDLALFVIAADDGWMPQTEEHLQILTYLGVTEAVIALTKIDLAAAEEGTIKDTVRRKLRDTAFASAPIVSTSVITGRGLEMLRNTLADVLRRTEPQRDIGKPRLPIDRVFVLRGIGVVVTGTLSGGPLQRGQTVVAQPGGQVARIRALQNHNRELEAVTPGMRTALNLSDVSAQSGPQSFRHAVERGDIVTLAELGNSHDTADVILERSPRLLDLKTPAGRPLKSGKRVRIHHGSGNFPARLILPSKELHAGERAIAQLQFEASVFAFAADRFIVRDWSEQQTLAGGIILDADADRRRFRTARQQEFLTARAKSITAETFVRSQLIRDGAVPRNQLLLKSRFAAYEISEATGRLQGEGGVVLLGEIAADGAWWRTLIKSASEAIDGWHRTHPEQIGMPLNQFRALLERETRAANLADAIIAELCRTEFAQAAAALHRKTHRPALPAHLRTAGDKLRAALTAKPFEPPARKELATDPVALQALRFLIETGEAIEVGPELVFSADQLSRARDLVRSFLRQNPSGTVSELRQAVGTNRRVIVPLLEYLDRTGVTLRQGDKRTLRERK